MNGPRLRCRDERRRHEVRRRDRNGLDYVEVSDDQLHLTAFFLGRAPDDLTTENFEIRGGRRIRGIQVVEVETCRQDDPELDDCVRVSVDRPGDFSTYELALVNLPEDTPFDDRYRSVPFSFKAGCPSEKDCRVEPTCPEEPAGAPEISYLARDYASFRRLILDRLSVVLPDWKDRHVPDLGITLVELLAYVGDHLSYEQDAVATEAYLATARRRISVRRHARLVDYLVHEGCNARAWIHVHTSADLALPAHRLWFLTAPPNPPEVEGRLLRWDDLREVPDSEVEVFEPVVGDLDGELSFRRAHNRIRLHTWGDGECCLPRGATSATLVDAPPAPDDQEADDHEEADDEAPGDEQASEEDGGSQEEALPERVLHLVAGDLLLFEEVLGPGTGEPADADPARRHVVRLTRVEPAVDELLRVPVLEVEWDEADALPFPLCVSTLGPARECEPLEDVSVARGNVVLADHGRRIDPPEKLGCVPLESSRSTCLSRGHASDPVLVPGPFHPVLARGPLTFAEPAPAGGPAAGALEQDPRRALPWIRLEGRPEAGCLGEPQGPGDDGGSQGGDANAAVHETWAPRFDLLGSGRDDRHYVVEMDDRRRAHLRFGDGELGARPAARTAFRAVYRTGNGPAGNVGAESLVLAVTDEMVSGAVLEPRNPLPAAGGTAPESLERVRLRAPDAFRHVRERAVTADDYAELAERHPAVQRAAAELRWNGSWYEARVAVDPLGRNEADPTLLAEIEEDLHRYRRLGHDLAVVPARYVPVELRLEICVRNGFGRGAVLEALRARFGTGRLADGSPAFFHPDALTFGDGVAVSRIVAAAHRVPGVESAAVTRLQRLFEEPDGELERGLLAVGPLEVARLDDDPDFPENGRLRFDLRGGR